MATAVRNRRRFDVRRDARRFVYLTTGGELFEVVAVRGIPADAGGYPDRHAALKLLNVAKPLPADPFEELEMAAWVPLAEVEPLDVVVPVGHDCG